jgi:hypothetical protein
VAHIRLQLANVGIGEAGIGCLEQILRHEHNFDITVFGEETHGTLSTITAGAPRDGMGRAARNPHLLTTANVGHQPACPTSLGVRHRRDSCECVA